MANSQESWSELGDKLQSLGLKLKLHYEEEAGDRPEEVGAGVKAGLERLGEALEDAFEALGNAVDDDGVRADAKDAGRLLLDAVDATFTQASGVLRDKLRRR